MDRVLTIVGASVRAAAASALRAGFTVHAADMFADADLRAGCHAVQVGQYPEDLAGVVNGPQPGGWMYTGALENYPALVHKLAQTRPLLGNGGRALRDVRQPPRIAKVLEAAGLLYPTTRCDAIAVARDGTWLRKSIRSAGGLQVAAWDSESQPLRRDEYLQRRIDGLACSAVYVAAAGHAVLLGVTRQLVGAAWTGARDFQYCGSLGPPAMSEGMQDSFSNIGAALARAFDLVGLFGVDAIVNDQGVWPVEINPRYTASTEIVEWAGNLKAIELHLAACASGHLPDLMFHPSDSCFGKAILFAADRFVVTPRLGARFEQVQQQPPKFADIPLTGTVIEAGWPIVSTLAAGPDEQAVLRTLERQAAEVQACIPE